MDFYLILLLALFIAVVLVLILYSKGSTKREIVKAGKEGENRTAFLLEALPDNYILIRNAVISYDGRESEIDNIVVGNTGVFVIETKNQKGHIFGDCLEKNWLQRKVGRGGTPYSKEFYNPTKQVSTHIYRLKHILLQNRIRIFISGAVYFSNPETVVSIDNPRDDIPVFQYRNKKELLNYILNGKEKLSDSEVHRITNIIKSNRH